MEHFHEGQERPEFSWGCINAKRKTALSISLQSAVGPAFIQQSVQSTVDFLSERDRFERFAIRSLMLRISDGARRETRLNPACTSIQGTYFLF